MTAASDSIGIVVCTYNRAPALTATLPVLLRLECVDQVVVVVDGSTDHTIDVLAGFSDPRLRVLRQAQAGSAAARNAGVAATSTTWVLLLDDDDFFPLDYARVLRDTARRQGADVVGAPWVHVRPAHVDEDLAAAKRRRSNVFGLDTHPSTFPADDLETPFLPARALFRRAVFDVITYDPGYRFNGWREETSLYLDALKAGFRVVLTPDTASFHARSWGGGQRRGSIRYELWVLRNNLRFLRRHAPWLRAHGQVSNVYLEQCAFAVSRATGTLRSWARARARRARRPAVPLAGGLADAG